MSKGNKNGDTDSSQLSVVTKSSIVSPVTTDSVVPQPMQYANISQLVWPTDVWGFTKDLRKALTMAASKINGHADKKKLFDDTLRVGLKHVNARYTEKQPERDVREAAKKASDAKADSQTSVD